MNAIPRPSPRFKRVSIRIPWLALLGTPLVLNAVEPAPLWWSIGSPPPMNSNATQPLGVANIGQAKYMAKCALEALYKINPAVANLISADLVGVGKPIPSWTPPIANTPEAQAQYAPLRVGQLKAIADPFYTRLNAVAPSWLAAQRQNNGTQDIAASGYIFPWTSATSDDSNKALASVGQVKAVFALRFEKDSDGDLFPDLWAFDKDGLTPAQEAVLGTSPLLDDTDGDGVNDDLDAFPLDPSRSSIGNPISGDTSPPLVTLEAPTSATYITGP